MVEISSLTEHLLTECDKKDGFGKCYRCSEAVLKTELPRHLKAKECHRECPPVTRPDRCSCSRVCQASRQSLARSSAPRSSVTSNLVFSISITSAAKSEKLANRCPLCHENFTPGEEVRGVFWGESSMGVSMPSATGCGGAGAGRTEVSGVGRLRVTLLEQCAAHLLFP